MIISSIYDFDFAVNDWISAHLTADWLDPIMRVITSLGDGGVFWILLALVVLCFKKTRRMGAAMAISLIISTLITNVTLKPLVFRARPYTHEEYRVLWEKVGALVESERSFPSGHTTCAMAVMMGIFLAAKNKKRWWPVLIFPFVMGFTRLYFVVHYPTDVLGGLVAGALAGLGGFALVYLLYRFLEKHKENKIVSLYLNCDPIVTAVRFVISKIKKPTSCESDATEQKNTPAD